MHLLTDTFYAQSTFQKKNCTKNMLSTSATQAKSCKSSHSKNRHELDFFLLENTHNIDTIFVRLNQVDLRSFTKDFSFYSLLFLKFLVFCRCCSFFIVDSPFVRAEFVLVHFILSVIYFWQ